MDPETTLDALSDPLNRLAAACGYQATPSTISPIESLRTLVAEAVTRHEALTHDAASSIVTLLTHKVRLGWMLCDARELLDGRRGFCSWASRHVALSLNSIYPLLRLARYFSRDCYPRGQSVNSETARS
jgi:hypothetical protein